MGKTSSIPKRTIDDTERKELIQILGGSRIPFKDFGNGRRIALYFAQSEKEAQGKESMFESMESCPEPSNNQGILTYPNRQTAMADAAWRAYNKDTKGPLVSLHGVREAIRLPAQQDGHCTSEDLRKPSERYEILNITKHKSYARESEKRFLALEIVTPYETLNNNVKFANDAATYSFVVNVMGPYKGPLSYVPQIIAAEIERCEIVDLIADNLRPLPAPENPAKDFEVTKICEALNADLDSIARQLGK